jgi:hypothetical protein
MKGPEEDHDMSLFAYISGEYFYALFVLLESTHFKAPDSSENGK